MTIKLLKPVLFLLFVLSVQNSWAQPNCIPAGSNLSATQLTYCLFENNYDFTIDNNLRHNNLAEDIILDQQNYDIQFVFNNPNADSLYLGIYLDLNDDGNYDYPEEMVFEGETNAANYSKNLALTEAVLDELAQGPKWMRMIVSGDQASVYNTCSFPGLMVPYQAVDVRSGRIKIRKSTARHDPGAEGICMPDNSDMNSMIFVENNYETDISIFKIIFWYGHEGYPCGWNYLLSYDLPGNDTMNYDYGEEVYYWQPSGGHIIPSGSEIEISNVIANSCWSPIDNFELRVDVFYNFPNVPASANQASKGFDFSEVSICEIPKNSGEGGGSYSNSSTDIWSSPTISPNPTSGNTFINFALTTAAKVHVEFYNLLGESISLPNQTATYTEGQHQIMLPTENLPVGTYIVNLKINEESTLLSKVIVTR